MPEMRMLVSPIAEASKNGWTTSLSVVLCTASAVCTSPNVFKPQKRLKTAIVDVADQIKEDRPMRARVMANYQQRLQTCLDRLGGQVEVR
ncbi:hypothetical protein M3Y94_00017500 [Aphelenchoides besseyi]|nr:hypothetical protein M3Y94_00017500 [Aphelenchoides besseyi]